MCGGDIRLILDKVGHTDLNLTAPAIYSVICDDEYRILPTYPILSFTGR
jgi:hypothetical protein